MALSRLLPAFRVRGPHSRRTRTALTALAALAATPSPRPARAETAATDEKHCSCNQHSAIAETDEKRKAAELVEAERASQLGSEGKVRHETTAQP